MPPSVALPCAAPNYHTKEARPCTFTMPIDIRLYRAECTEGHMSRNYPPEARLEGFLDSEWIAEELYRVKPGKEATVLCCR